MKYVIAFACFLFAGLLVMAQEKSQITVKGGSTTPTRVLIVTAREGEKTLELQCNEGTNHCLIPPNGSYWMVRLPKNRGLYECANVELYKDGPGEQAEQKIGEYCLTRIESNE